MCSSGGGTLDLQKQGCLFSNSIAELIRSCLNKANDGSN